MSFWLNVGLAYLLLLGLGLAAGAYFGSRRRRGGRGFGSDPGPEPVDPTGPTLAAGWLPLGSAFDRKFMPAAFGDDEALVSSA